MKSIIIDLETDSENKFESEIQRLIESDSDFQNFSHKSISPYFDSESEIETEFEF